MSHLHEPKAEERSFELESEKEWEKRREEILECRAEDAEELRASVREPLDQMANAAEMLWVVLANVSGGDWTKQSADWQIAAARWRDNYYKALDQLKVATQNEGFEELSAKIGQLRLQDVPAPEYDLRRLWTPDAPLTALALPEDDVPDAAPEVK